MPEEPDGGEQGLQVLLQEVADDDRARRGRSGARTGRAAARESAVSGTGLHVLDGGQDGVKLRRAGRAGR